ncbi:MAG TPA: sulfate/molybdate ABC transporter ATP-binding protein [Steroidobacteraceae bacterium]|nr:sulfate/molybdate ABC transporter ATP-binding protein [Steroidobacteraceae bacterium]
MQIEIRDIRKEFGKFPALQQVDLTIHSGELIALLGPSGSGKTTLLRLIAGLDYPARGSILFGHEDIANHPIRERRVGFVFQHYALFRHLTVFENIAFGLRVRRRRDRPGEAAIRARVLELLELVQLAGLEQRYPAQLSGGQRQRVALARALAIEPRVLLLDEPFGALDAKVRKELRRWLRELHDRTGYTTVFVTHDQEEALELADRVVIMNKGRVEQVGTPEEVYERPASPYVFHFLGNVNVLPCQLAQGAVRIGAASLPLCETPGLPPGAVDVYVRPHDVQVVAGDVPGLDVTVREIRRTGATVHLRTVLDGSDSPFDIELPHLDPAAVGRAAGDRLRVALAAWRLFPRT